MRSALFISEQKNEGYKSVKQKIKPSFLRISGGDYVRR